MVAGQDLGGGGGDVRCNDGGSDGGGGNDGGDVRCNDGGSDRGDWWR